MTFLASKVSIAVSERSKDSYVRGLRTRSPTVLFQSDEVKSDPLIGIRKLAL